MHAYIYDGDITVETDQKSLSGVFKKATHSIRLERIALRVQDYDFTLVNEPRKRNRADGLSRIPTIVSPTEVNFVEEHVHFVKKDIALLSSEETQEAGKKDVEMLTVMTAIKEG